MVTRTPQTASWGDVRSRRRRKGLPPPPAHLARAEAAAGSLHLGRRFQPELVPLLSISFELHALVVLQPAEERLEALVALHLRDSLLQDLDGSLALAALVL